MGQLPESFFFWYVAITFFPLNWQWPALWGDGIYADSQEKPSAARARRERRKRQGTVQTPIVPDIVEDPKQWGWEGWAVGTGIGGS